MLGALVDVPFVVHGRAVYVATTGPRLETAAEIRKFCLLGGDLVGQTLAPEVFLARELEFCYTALTYVVNYAEGLLDRPYAPGVLFEGLATPAEIERVRAVEAAWPELIITAAAGPGRHLPPLPLPPAHGTLPPEGRYQ